MFPYGFFMRLILKMKIRHLSILILILLLFVSCKGQKRFDVNLSENRVEVKIARLDKGLIAIDTLNAQKSVRELYHAYPGLLELYLSNFNEVQLQDTAAVTNVLRDFVSYPTVVPINIKVAQVFQNISNIEHEVSDAFTRINHFFPNITLPQLFFYVSGLNKAMIASPGLDTIGIGCDFYLGSNFEPYKSVVYDYVLPNMRPESLVPDLVSTILSGNFRFDGQQNRLIDNMLYRGKLMYLLSVLMPDRAENEIIGYTVEQENWAKSNEKEIWKAIVANKDIFSSNQHLIRQYMNEAPFTAPLSQDSPGMIGEWIGLQIVRSLMNKNYKMSLTELMQMNDYELLLQKSGYQP